MRRLSPATIAGFGFLCLMVPVQAACPGGCGHGHGGQAKCAHGCGQGKHGHPGFAQGNFFCGPGVMGLFGCPGGPVCKDIAGPMLNTVGCAYYGSETLAAVWIAGPTNWAWRFPDAGVTAYPGQPGTGYQAQSDYTRTDWIRSPSENAKAVCERLAKMGIPKVTPEPEFLGKNPCLPTNLKLPIPNQWVVDPEAEKARKEKDKAKKADIDKDKKEVPAEDKMQKPEKPAPGLPKPKEEPKDPKNPKTS